MLPLNVGDRNANGGFPMEVLWQVMDESPLASGLHQRRGDVPRRRPLHHVLLRGLGPRSAQLAGVDGDQVRGIDHRRRRRDLT